MTTPTPSNWKAALLRSIGAGVGFALTLSAIGVMLVWYSNRPKPEKPWNSSAIKAIGTGSQFSVQTDRVVCDFRYSLQNGTGKDYKLPSNVKLMERLAQHMNYRDAPNMTLEQNLYIPSGQKVNVSIILPIMYSDFDFSKEKASDEKQLSAFIDRRLAELDGFVLFDPTNRYKVDFPNGWPEAVARAKARAESQHADLPPCPPKDPLGLFSAKACRPPAPKPGAPPCPDNDPVGLHAPQPCTPLPSKTEGTHSSAM